MTKTKSLVTCALLTAMIVILGFTPIGYLKIGIVEITFLTIPVMIGAIVLSPKYSAVLGGVFGLTSFIQALTAASPFGAAIFAVSPVRTFIVCVISRILMGLFCGLIFRAIRNRSRFLVAGLSGALLNTVLFVGGLILLFGKSDYIQGMIATFGGGNLIRFILAFVGINGLIEAVVCTVLGTAIGTVVYRATARIRQTNE